MASQSDDTGVRERPEEHNSRVSRRAFLKAGGAGALTGAVAASVLFEESTASAQARWNHEADVVVAGSGGAASVAALFAFENKASVIILEKAGIYGGTTAKSGGVIWIPNNHFMKAMGIVDKREDLLRYLARISYPTLYDPADSARFGMPEDTHQLHATFYDQAAATLDTLTAMGLKYEMQMEDFPKKQLSVDYYGHLPENKAPRGRNLLPPSGGQAGGADLIRQLRTMIDARKIPVLMEHRVERLVLNGKGEVVGVEARNGTQTVSVRARKGVIFGTGGFTSNPEMCLQYLRGPIFGGCTVPTGEGDFVKIASAVRAKLGNMTHAWWWPVMVEQALQNRSTPSGIAQTPGDSVVLVNCEGKRCVNEKIQYNERTQAHFYWDPVRGRYPNHIMIMIYDQSCRERFGATGGLIVRPGLSAPYVLTAQTLEQLATVVDQRLAQLASKTGNYRLDPSFSANLKETIARFNQFAMTGKDLDFHRGEAAIELRFHGDPRGNTAANYTMKPIAATGPYFAVLIGGGTLDTKGGPKINAKCEVLDVDEKPIPGLYGAGNCIAAPAGQAYWSSGATIGSGMTFGAVAGKSAAIAPVKQATAPRQQTVSRSA
jgi:succinate dehydrogenase/fumarate reductase flavoprotein subunit